MAMTISSSTSVNPENGDVVGVFARVAGVAMVAGFSCAAAVLDGGTCGRFLGRVTKSPFSLRVNLLVEFSPL